MSRIANKPVEIPKDVTISYDKGSLIFKGPLGEINMNINNEINIDIAEDKLNVVTENQNYALAGTIRSLINNNVKGVTKGFVKELNLVGVGYKAEVKNKSLHLNLGFSHPIIYKYEEDISIETPSQTEVIIKGVNNQKVGQVAAEIRAFRPPEPYKGKGVKYKDEHIIRKEAKKK